ncbi:MAG: ribosome recycling factor [Candidatus Paralactobacillus gallistercoris]|uniref:Ribosome-recycling factor n=1 Tax=Candidatus Paralactobacillus gallistercoris TaxID=2838724 RepID=A0A948TI22_9LACO|nr:ribosome recycling factor [Candidatus Paralactobacillus gallistercoris]
MPKNPILEKAQQEMEKSAKALQQELGRMRAGRANASLLDRVMVEYYGVPTPLNQVAAITIPEARVLMVTPYDKSSLKNIERALLESDLGINPANDGTVIRLVVPQLTGERRKELAKEVKKTGESTKGTIRRIRHDGLNELRKQQKNGDITEDELYDLEGEMQKLTDQANKKLDQIVADKQKEILAD